VSSDTFETFGIFSFYVGFARGFLVDTRTQNLRKLFQAEITLSLFTMLLNMEFSKKIPTILLFAASALPHSAGASESVAPDILFKIAGIPVTNSMATTWGFVIVSVILLRLLIRGGASIVPGKGQIVLESIIASLKEILEPVMGKRAFKAAFPLLLGIFFFVLMMNWSGLLPGVGSIGKSQKAEIVQGDVAAYKEAGFHITPLPEGKGSEVKMYEAEKFTPFLRPANSDFNTAFGLALISFGAWIYFVMRYAGPKALLYDWFGNKADRKDTPLLIYICLTPIFFAVGFIEIISTLIRPISLSCRLFGNVFGGEVLLESMYGVFAYILPVPFCFFELLVGLVQAFIFTLLTAVYIGLITNHESPDGSH